MGLDEAGINDDRDMLQEMRLVLRLHRVPGMEDGVPTAAQVFQMATENGALTTGFGSTIGTLEPGQGRRSGADELATDRLSVSGCRQCRWSMRWCIAPRRPAWKLCWWQASRCCGMAIHPGKQGGDVGGAG